MSAAVPPRPAHLDPLRFAVVGGAMLVTAFAIYAAATALTALARGGWTTPPLWVLLAATVVVAVVLPMVHRGADRMAARLAYGERADAYTVMAEFIGRVANTLAVDDVLPRLAETAARSVHSRRGEIRLWLEGGREWRQVWPPGDDDIATGVSVDVQHGGSSVGEIEVDAASGMTVTDRELLGELARPAGLALSTVRLTFELRERFEQVQALNVELEASQRRIVETGRRERERFRADADRLVTPALSATTAAMDEARGTVVTAPTSVQPLLDSARAHAGEALDALRNLARGIYPPVLADRGLVAALDAWRQRAGIAVTVEATAALEELRAQPVTEAAIYFCCVTAATAVAGAASGGRARIELGIGDLEVRFAIAGEVLEPVRGRLADVVLTVRDRAEALGGGVVLDGHGSGSALRGWIPRGRPE